MKKIIFVVFLMTLSLMASAETVEIDGIWYDVIEKGGIAEVAKPAVGIYSGVIVIPESITYDNKLYRVTTIGKHAFNHCTDLKSVSLPNSITKIDEQAFAECRYIKSIPIPNSVKIIGNSAFYHCAELTSVRLPDALETVDPWAFTSCSAIDSVYVSDLKHWLTISWNGSSHPQTPHLIVNGQELKEVVIPDDMTAIPNYAFTNCYGITSVSMSEHIESIGDYAFGICKSLTTINLADGLKHIGEYAFFGCSSLSRIDMPNSVVSCGPYAFYRCSGLASVVMSDALETIGINTFSGCTALTSVHLPDNAELIDDGAFSRCTSLQSITIPKWVKRIGSSTFKECTSLRTVELPQGMTSIDYHAFWECTALENITIPQSIITIGFNAFEKCTSLVTVNLPNGMSVIQRATFSGCSKIKSVTIGNGIKKIESGAFEGCTSLADFYCLSEEVPETDEIVFQNSYIEYATLHVPAASVNAYKAAEPWKKFQSITAISGDVPKEKQCAKPTINYERGKLTFSCDTEGAEIVTEITDSDIKKYHDAVIDLTATYHITAYATAAGHSNSEVVTATLCWIDVDPKTEGIADGVTQVRANAVLIQAENGQISVTGVDYGTNITVYSGNGEKVGSTISSGSQSVISTHLGPNSIAIVKIGDRSIKVVMK